MREDWKIKSCNLLTKMFGEEWEPSYRTFLENPGTSNWLKAVTCPKGCSGNIVFHHNNVMGKLKKNVIIIYLKEKKD